MSLPIALVVDFDKPEEVACLLDKLTDSQVTRLMIAAAVRLNKSLPSGGYVDNYPPIFNGDPSVPPINRWDLKCNREN